MSLRKTHQKTKYGCSTCKKRRIKCDDGRPDCNNCKRRGVECSFRTFDPAPRSITPSHPSSDSYTNTSIQPFSSPSSSTLASLLPESLLDGLPDILRPRFTQLIHHFATSTSATISHDIPAQEAWCNAVPQIGRSHAFVIKGMFAITALHLSRTATEEKERSHLHTIAAAQMNTGMIHYRGTIGNVTAENAEALFMYAVIVTAFTSLSTVDECRALLQSIRSGTQPPDQRETSIVRLAYSITAALRSQRGVRVILIPCWHHISKGVLGPVVSRDWWPFAIPATPLAISDDQKLKEIEMLWMQPGRPYEFWFDVLIQALKKLREDFALVSQLVAGNDQRKGCANGHDFDWSAVMAWPIGLPPEFTNLLEQRKPEAWVILAHYAILLSKAGEIWWVQDMAPNMVSTAALVLGKNMRKWIEWPASVVGIDLNDR